MTLRAKANGFTLIELIVVIVILGILAAVAMPKFVDLSGNAHQGAAQGVAGGLSSGLSANYATCRMNPAAADCVPRSTLNLGNVCDPSTLALFLSGTGVTLNAGTGGTQGAQGDNTNFYVNGNGSCAALSGQTSCVIRPAGTSGAADATLSVDCSLFKY